MFKGSGRIGSAGNYRFQLAISAGAAATPAQFALRIWHVDPLTKAEVLDYDNAVTQSGQTASRIVEGGIVHE